MRFSQLVAREVRRTVKRPRRIVGAFDRTKWHGFRRGLAGERLSGRWVEGEGIRYREYLSYQAYVSHQRTKLDTPGFAAWLEDYDRDYCEALSSRLDGIGVDLSGKSVLCLGARIGTEVRAFLDKGAFALGIDLNPGPQNPFVVVGDFHNLQYPDSCVDIVFSNSLDHALDLDKIASEVNRVLRNDGQLILELMAGTTEGGTAGAFEATHWTTIDDALAAFADYTVETRTLFEYPWVGENVVLQHSAFDAQP